MSDDTGGPCSTPPARNYSPWYQWMARLAATTTRTRCPRRDPAAIPAWVERRRARLAELLGPEPDAVPLNLETLESSACDGYRRDKIVFDTEDTMSVPAYLLVPDARAGPAARARPSWPATATGRASRRSSGWSTPTCPTPTTRSSWRAGATSCWRPTCAASASVSTGTPRTTTPATPTWSTPPWRAGTRWRRTSGTCGARLDVLEQHPLVDPDRLGMVGISYGGTVTLFTAAVDHRVAAAVVSGYFSSWAESHKMPWNMCGSQILFGMLGRLEHEDLGALVAPRPLLVETGTEDVLFPVATATESVRRTRLVYEQHGRARTAWCTTSSRAATSGTAPRPCPSSTAGSAHDPADRRGLNSQVGVGPTLPPCCPSPGSRRSRGVTQHLVERGLGRTAR